MHARAGDGLRCLLSGASVKKITNDIHRALSVLKFRKMSKLETVSLIEEIEQLRKTIADMESVFEETGERQADEVNVAPPEGDAGFCISPRQAVDPSLDQGLHHADRNEDGSKADS